VKYVCEVALENKFIAFFTTHSSAVIDMLSHNENAQIVHVTNHNDVAKARRVTTYVDNRGVIDDLDVRASDLLQANCVVWVEGPSDRLYFNRWISLVTGGSLEEGTHYQCVFYGGRLLAHLSGVQPFETADQEQAVRIFRVNRNAIVIMDSDKSSSDDKVNHTKSRIVSEVRALEGMAWVTAGREVENYLSIETLRRRFPSMKALPNEFYDISDALEECAAGEGKKFERNKVMFAETIIPLIERADLAGILDLETKIVEACKTIAYWNRIEPAWA